MKNRNTIFTSVLLMLGCFALLRFAQAVVPPPDGGYPGGNTAEGQNALFSLTTGGFNTAVGFFSLRGDTTGQLNTALGAGTLLTNTADENTATGAGALLTNSTGSSNTATGTFALLNNTTGNANTAIGRWALRDQTTAVGNTAVGVQALQNNVTGSANTALGTAAGYNVTTADNVICIGALGADVSSTTWIANVYGVTTQSGTTAPVVVSDGGQLGTIASSKRFKKHIASMGKTSEAILSLKPVTFHYKSDAKGTPQFGLIAEEVAKVNPALVLPDKDGKPHTVRYDAVNAMLLNEFLKEHRRVEQLERRINEQDRTVAQLRKEMQTVVAHAKEQDSKFQKVNAQLAATNPSRRELEIRTATPNIVLNNP